MHYIDGPAKFTSENPQKHNNPVKIKEIDNKVSASKNKLQSTDNDPPSPLTQDIQKTSPPSSLHVHQAAEALMPTALTPQEKEEKFASELLPLLEKEIFGKNFFKRNPHSSSRHAKRTIMDEYLKSGGQQRTLELIKKSPDLFLLKPITISLLLDRDSSSSASSLVQGLGIISNTEQEALIETLGEGEEKADLLNYLIKNCADFPTVDLTARLMNFKSLKEQNNRLKQLKSELGSAFTFSDIYRSTHLSDAEKLKLRALADKVPSYHLMEHLNPGDLDLNMLRTYILMGEVLISKSPHTVHIGKVRGLLGHSFFSVTPEGQIYLSKEFINAGYNKKVNKVYHLNTGQVKIRARVDRDKIFKKSQSEETANLALQEAEMEEKLALYFKHSLLPGEKSYNLNPAEFAEINNKNQYIAFGEIYHGDGIDLLHLPLKHRVASILDIGKALTHIHQLGIVHRDIKIDNMLISKPTDDKPVEAVLGDYAYARPVNAEVSGGTARYQPPEDNNLGFSADIWSYGLLLLVAVDGEKGMVLNLLEAFNKSKSDPVESRKLLPRFLFGVRKHFETKFTDPKEKKATEIILDVAEKCLGYEESTRISVRETLEPLEVAKRLLWT